MIVLLRLAATGYILFQVFFLVDIYVFGMFVLMTLGVELLAEIQKLHDRRIVRLERSVRSLLMHNHIPTQVLESPRADDVFKA